MKARGKKTPPIPFRGKASQCSQRRVSRPAAAASSSHEAPESEEPEAEPEEPVEEEEPVVAEEEVAEVPMPNPPEPRPSLEEHEAKWQSLFEKHSRPVPGEFGRDNLVPLPVPAL